MRKTSNAELPENNKRNKTEFAHKAKSDSESWTEGKKNNQQQRHTPGWFNQQQSRISVDRLSHIRSIKRLRLLLTLC